MSFPTVWNVSAPSTESLCDNWHFDQPATLPCNDLTRPCEEGQHSTKTPRFLAGVTLGLYQAATLVCLGFVYKDGSDVHSPHVEVNGVGSLLS